MQYSSIIHALGIPHSALISIVLGMMLVSFPLGIYVVFNTNIGEHISHEIPLSLTDVVGVPPIPIPNITLGDAFVIVWSIYVILFSLAILGPRRSIMSSLKDSLYGNDAGSNYMIKAIAWFGVLVLASTVIDTIQGYLDLSLVPPRAENDLVQFYLITLSPIIEESIFRAALVGLPVFLLYTHRMSLSFLIKALWHPARHLHVHDAKKITAIILVSSILFGAAHVLSGNTWGADKVAQASVAGIILGYVYYRYGLLCSIMIHWATNYFLYAYGYFVAHIGDWNVLDAFEQPFFGTIQTLLVAIGIITIAVKIMQKRIPAHS